VIRNENHQLAVEPTVVIPPEYVQLAHTGLLGDPCLAFWARLLMARVLAAESVPAGVVVGSGHGPGVGPGWGDGIGGADREGSGVTAPRVIVAPDPEFSEEVRKAKFQGTLVLFLVVGIDERAHDARVIRSLGMGLDEKALEAIGQWRFEAGRTDGNPVAVQVKVSFRLYQSSTTQTHLTADCCPRVAFVSFVVCILGTP